MAAAPLRSKLQSIGTAAAKSNSTLSQYEFKESPLSSHARLLAALPPAGGGSAVLDLGCGDGYVSARLAARGYAVTGVERAGCHAQPFPESVRLVEADLDAGLPAFDRRFDYVLCGDILEHLKDPLRMLRDIRACLAPGGLLVASLPNSGNIYFRLNVLAGRFPRHDKGLFDRTHLHFFAWKGWVELFDQAGFQVGAALVTPIPVAVVFPRWSGTFAVRAAEALSYGLARLWKRLFAYQFVVAARAVEPPQ